MKRSNAAVAGKSQLTPRARECNDGKHGKPSLGGAGVNSGVTSTCEVAGETNRANDDNVVGQIKSVIDADSSGLDSDASPSSQQ
mmetsp:Transcript_35830/g.61100  ORF Transcript_35830/g.61100 Transcript_35830/m.61100 type:complete len:84 (-) Transcript_35830:389-640(-)